MALRRTYLETLGTRMVKVYRDSEIQEYQVWLYVGGILQKDAIYFTSDKDDALGTAARMLKAT